MLANASGTCVEAGVDSKSCQSAFKRAILVIAFDFFNTLYYFRNFFLCPSKAVQPEDNSVSACLLPCSYIRGPGIDGLLDNP